MFAAYVTVTILASVFNGIAAVTYLIGHDYPKAQADMKRVPRSWVPVSAGRCQGRFDHGGNRICPA
jgi:hypothetical protein